MELRTIFFLSVGCFQLIYARRVTISEGRNRILRCSLGQVLNIKSAKYEGDFILCGDNDVTSIVQSQCQHNMTCMVYAKDEHFGDTCRWAQEILTITYRCISKDEITTPETTKSKTVSMATTLTYSTRWHPTGTNDSVTGHDCYYRVGKAIYYHGTTSITETGKKCQWWDDNKPHIPKIRPKAGGQRNYCRNPDGDIKRPWCYTMDPNTRWEYCDIKDCDEIATSETTKSSTVSMVSTLTYSTRMQSKGTNDSVTGPGNQTNISTGESKLIKSPSHETITIATLIAGCIFGLLLIGILTIAIFRRFRENKDDGSVLVLQMSSVSQELINQGQSNGSVRLPSDTNVRNIPTRYFGNNAYALQQSDTPIVSETTTSKYVDQNHQLSDDGEYTEIEQYSADSLPPSYDSVSRNNPSSAGQTDNEYSHAHYSADDYDISDGTELSQGTEYLSEGYSKASSLAAKAKHKIGKSEHVYENENLKCNQNCRSSKSRSHVKTNHLLTKNNRENPPEKNKGQSYKTPSNENCIKTGNQYDDIDFKTGSMKSHYQNVENDDSAIKGQNHGYMPMEFGKGGSVDETDNFYVPVMSPTSTLPSDVFDDTYRF